MEFERLDKSCFTCMAAVPRKVAFGVSMPMSCGRQATLKAVSWAMREEYFCPEHAEELLKGLQNATNPLQKSETREIDSREAGTPL